MIYVAVAAEADVLPSSDNSLFSFVLNEKTLGKAACPPDLTSLA